MPEFLVAALPDVPGQIAALRALVRRKCLWSEQGDDAGDDGDDSRHDGNTSTTPPPIIITNSLVLTTVIITASTIRTITIISTKPIDIDSFDGVNYQYYNYAVIRLLLLLALLL